MSQNNFGGSVSYAALDASDLLASYRDRFHFPEPNNDLEPIYFTGNSLGLMPKKAREYVDEELDDWARLGVEAHVNARHPWLPYHEFLTEQMAAHRRCKAGRDRRHEFADRQSASADGLVLSADMRKVQDRHRKRCLPVGPVRGRVADTLSRMVLSSDHSRDSSTGGPAKAGTQNALIELSPRDGESTLRTEDIVETIEREGGR